MRHAFVLREEPDSPYAAPLVPQPSPAHLLPPRPRPSPRPVALADPPLERSIQKADRLALSLRRALEHIAVPLAGAAAAFARARAWSAFGFARLNDHARERFDRSGRWVRDLAALGEALAALPALATALTGEDSGPPLGRVAAHIIGRVASPASLDAWIALARAVPVRVLRDAVKQATDAATVPAPPASLQPAPQDRVRAARALGRRRLVEGRRCPDWRSGASRAARASGFSLMAPSPPPGPTRPAPSPARTFSSACTFPAKSPEISSSSLNHRAAASPTMPRSIPGEIPRASATTDPPHAQPGCFPIAPAAFPPGSACWPFWRTSSSPGTGWRPPLTGSGPPARTARSTKRARMAEQGILTSTGSQAGTENQARMVPASTARVGTTSRRWTGVGAAVPVPTRA